VPSRAGGCPGPGDLIYGALFKRFTEPARQVVVHAQVEARGLKHDYIGTEHILLGLLRQEEGLAARVLGSLGVSIEEVRAQVARIVGQGDEVTTGQIPFTPRAKKVLELALREARALGHRYIGTEHILLGLAREGDGVAARILADFDLAVDQIRHEVVAALSKAPGGRRGTGPGPFVVTSPRRPRRWEHRVESIDHLDAAGVEWLNSLGQDGWQLTALARGDDGWRLYFKRTSG
jgi:ATP-dependent Clp protease ATP-binding subunit ClpA